MASFLDTIEVLFKTRVDRTGTQELRREAEDTKRAVDSAGGGLTPHQQIKAKEDEYVFQRKTVDEERNALDVKKSIALQQKVINDLLREQERLRDAPDVSYSQKSGRYIDNRVLRSRVEKDIMNETSALNALKERSGVLDAEGGESGGGGFHNRMYARSAALSFMTGGVRGAAYGTLGATTNAMMDSPAMFAAWVPLGFAAYKEMQFLQSAWDANKNWSRNALPLTMKVGDANAMKGFDEQLFQKSLSSLINYDVSGKDFNSIISTLQSRTPEKFNIRDTSTVKMIENMVNMGLDPSQSTDLLARLSLRTGQRSSPFSLLTNLESGMFRGMPKPDDGSIAKTALLSILTLTNTLTESISNRIGRVGERDINRVTGMAASLYSFGGGVYRDNAQQIMQMLDQSGKNWQDPMTMMIAMQQNGGNFTKAYGDIQRGGLLNNVNKGRIEMFRRMGLAPDMIATMMDISTGGNNLDFWKNYISIEKGAQGYHPSSSAASDMAKYVGDADEARRKTGGFIYGATERGEQTAELAAGRKVGELFAGSLENLQKQLEQLAPYFGAVAAHAREFDHQRSSNSNLRGYAGNPGLQRGMMYEPKSLSPKSPSR